MVIRLWGQGIYPHAFNSLSHSGCLTHQDTTCYKNQGMSRPSSMPSLLSLLNKLLLLPFFLCANCPQTT